MLREDHGKDDTSERLLLCSSNHAVLRPRPIACSGNIRDRPFRVHFAAGSASRAAENNEDQPWRSQWTGWLTAEEQLGT